MVVKSLLSTGHTLDKFVLDKTGATALLGLLITAHPVLEIQLPCVMIILE